MLYSKTIKNKIKAPGHLRSPKTSTQNNAQQQAKPHPGWWQPSLGPPSYL